MSPGPQFRPDLQQQVGLQSQVSVTTKKDQLGSRKLPAPKITFKNLVEADS